MEFLTSDDIFSKIESIVENAEDNIKIVSAWFKGNALGKLLEKTDNNAEIYLVLRASEFRDLSITDNRFFERLKDRNVKIYVNNRLHAKFIVADDKEAVVGSANFTDRGLSPYKEGNIEAAAYISEKEDIETLINYYNDIVSDSIFIDDTMCGFALCPVKTKSFSFVLINKDIQEQSYVEVKTGNESVLAKISSIYSYNIGFFSNPFSNSESNVFSPFEDFKTLFSQSNNPNWTKAAVLAYLNEKGNNIRIAEAEIIGSLIKDKDADAVKIDTLMRPFDSGSIVFLASDESMKALMRSNFSRSPMKCAVKVGYMNDGKTEVFVDAYEVNTKHMLVLGTTGSGKSYFTKLFLSRLSKPKDNKECDTQIFILDPHGEYYDPLTKNFSVPENDIHRAILPDTLFYVSPEDIENLIKELGFEHLIKTQASFAQNNKSKIRSYARPYLYLTEFSKHSLYDLLKELQEKNKTSSKKKSKKDNEEDEMENNKEDQIKEISIHELAEQVYGKRISNQPEVHKEIMKGLNSNKKITIFDFSNITDPKTRVSLAGLIMQELFFKNRKDKKNRLLVLEEAHNFAPETSYGDISSGRDNLALTVARKIASEGRKFNLGLLVITQRPAQVSKYVLSQANTQAMFRTMNSADLVSIENYIEFAGKDLIELLPSLQTGIGIFSGLGVPFPIVAKVE